MAVKINSTAGAALLASFGTVAAGDDLVLSDGAEVYNTDCDLDSATKEFRSFTAPKNFEGGLGVPGTNVKIDLSATTYTSDGNLYYDSGGSDAYFEAVNGIKNTWIRDTAKGRFHAAAGPWTNIDIGGGQFSLLANATLANLYAKGAVAMLLEYNASGLTTFDLAMTRKLLMRRAATTSRFFDSEVKFDNRDVALATVTLYRSMLWYNGTNITSLYLFPGSVLDLRGLTQDLTISAGELWAGAEIIMPRGFSLTISSESLRAGGPRTYNG